MDRARRGVSGALYPQSALAGLNSLSRGWAFSVSPSTLAVMAESRVMLAHEPGQVRKEAALSGSQQAQRGRSTGAIVDDKRLKTCSRKRVHGPYLNLATYSV